MSIEKPSGPVADVVGVTALPVPSKVVGNVGRSRASVIHSLNAEDAVLLALRAHIGDTQAENEKSLSLRAGMQKIYLNTLLKIFTEKKKNDILQADMRRLTRLLAKVCSEQEKGVIDKHPTEEAVVA